MLPRISSKGCFSLNILYSVHMNVLPSLLKSLVARQEKGLMGEWGTEQISLQHIQS